VNGVNLTIVIESAPRLVDAENFAFMLKEIFEYSKTAMDFDDVKAFLARDYSDRFNVHCGGSHIAIHPTGVHFKERILLITESVVSDRKAVQS
jgi:hypothetical protein